MCTMWWHFDVKDKIFLCVCMCVYAQTYVYENVYEWICVFVYRREHYMREERNDFIGRWFR